MKKKLLMLPLAAVLLLGSCAGDNSGIVAPANNATNEEINVALKQNVENLDTEAATMMKGDVIGAKLAASVKGSATIGTFFSNTTDISAEAAINLDLKTLREAASYMPSQANPAGDMTKLAEAMKKDASAAYGKASIVFKTEKDKDKEYSTVDDINTSFEGYISLKDAQAILKTKEGTKEEMKSTDISAYTSLYYAFGGGFVNSFTTETTKFSSTVMTFVQSMMGSMGIGDVTGMIPFGDGELPISVDEDSEIDPMMIVSLIPQIEKIQADVKAGTITSEQGATQVYALLVSAGAIDDTELSNGQKKIFKDMISVALTVDFSSIYDVTYGDKTFSYAINVDNIFTKASDIVDKVIAKLATHLNSTDSDEAEMAAGFTSIAQMAKVIIPVYKPSSSEIKSSVKWNNKTSIEANATFKLKGDFANIEDVMAHIVVGEDGSMSISAGYEKIAYDFNYALGGSFELSATGVNVPTLTIAK